MILVETPSRDEGPASLSISRLSAVAETMGISLDEAARLISSESQRQPASVNHGSSATDVGAEAASTVPESDEDWEDASLASESIEANEVISSGGLGGDRAHNKDDLLANDVDNGGAGGLGGGFGADEEDDGGAGGLGGGFVADEEDDGGGGDSGHQQTTYPPSMSNTRISDSESEPMAKRENDTRGSEVCSPDGNPSINVDESRPATSRSTGKAKVPSNR